jgi:hypothetical protein
MAPTDVARLRARVARRDLRTSYSWGLEKVVVGDR